MTTLAKCQDKREWDDYILENEGHPLQLWGWGDLKSAHGWSADRLFYHDEEGDVVGAVQLLIRKLPKPFKSLAYVPRGPVVGESNRDGLLNALGDYVKRNYKSVAVSIEPDSEDFSAPDNWKKSKNHILPSKTIILDLNKTEADLLSAMSKKTRQYIRKSSAEKINIKRVHNRDDFDKCMQIYRDTAKRARFELHSYQYYLDAFEKMGDHSQLFAAFYDDQPIAFLWLAISASTAYELYGGMDAMGQQLRSNYALKWYAIRKCKEWGLERYDFGGLIDGGVSTFKLTWVDEPTELAGTYDLPLTKLYGAYSGILPKAKNTFRKLRSILRS